MQYCSDFGHGQVYRHVLARGLSLFLSLLARISNVTMHMAGALMIYRSKRILYSLMDDLKAVYV